MCDKKGTGVGKTGAVTQEGPARGVKRKTLLDFCFSTQKKTSNGVVCSPAETESDIDETEPSLSKYDSLVNVNDGKISSVVNMAGSSASSTNLCNIINYDNDIGIFIGKKLDDFTLAKILEQPWSPPIDYIYPHSVHSKGNSQERRYVKKEHLQKYSWLALSDAEKGLYCRFCPFFATGHVGGVHKSISLQSLVTTPLRKFAKLLGKDGALETHAKTRYHAEAVQKGLDFLKSLQDPKNVVINQLDTARMQQVRENRARLISIIDNVVFLGRQNIAFRGHRDDGAFELHGCDADRSNNEGNFRELLRFRMECGDKDLEKHLSTASSRKMYTSKTTQNALIECCGEEILSIIIERVRKSKFYSILFDETTDVSHVSQLSLVLRYEYESHIREDFVGFINPRKRERLLSPQSDSEQDEYEPEDDKLLEPALTGERLGQVVLKMLQDLHLNPRDCVGITTDGCSVMTSEICGAVKEIQKEAVHATRCPCYNHALNLSISKSSTVQCVRNTTGIMSQVISFFNASSKRHAVLVSTVVCQLTKLCETRWVERHDAVLQFKTQLVKIAEALQIVSEWKERHSAANAQTLLLSVCDPTFIVTMICLSDVLSATLPLSRFLQKKQLDRKAANDAIQDTISVLNEKRKEVRVNEVFSGLYFEAEETANTLGVTSITVVPRTTKKQTLRCNVPADTAEEYYRRSVFIPLLEAVVEDLKSRFPSEVIDVYSLNMFLPGRKNDRAEENMKILASRYCNLLAINENDLQNNLKVEFSLWTAKWKRQQEKNERLPQFCTEVVDECDSVLFPNIRKLLCILCCLPASNASPERTFSTLRRIKTWLRSRCGQKRLNGLALMHILRDIPINKEKVVSRFAQGSARRKSSLVV